MSQKNTPPPDTALHTDWWDERHRVVGRVLWGCRAGLGLGLGRRRGLPSGHAAVERRQGQRVPVVHNAEKAAESSGVRQMDGLLRAPLAK